MNIELRLLAFVLVALTGFDIRADFAEAEQTQFATTFQNNASHTGHASIANFHGKLKLLWSRDLGRGGVSYPLIAKGMIFVSVGNKGARPKETELVALNATSGATVWETKIKGTYNWSSAAYDNDQVFVVNTNGVVTAFDAASGTEKWRKLVTEQVSSALVASNGQLFLDGYDGIAEHDYAINELNGKTQWKSDAKGNGDSAPALGDGGVYVSYPCEYFGFSEQSGKLEWFSHKSCDGGGGWAPVYFDGKVYERDKVLGTCIIREATTGKEIGKFFSGSPPSFFTYKKVSYGVEFNNLRMRGFDPTSGTILWTFTGDAHLASSPITVNQYAIIGSELGNLYVVDATTGKMTWSMYVGAGIPSPIEGDVQFPLTGLGAANGLVVVPAGSGLMVFAKGQP